MKTLLDTDIFSEVIKGKDANVLARAEQYLAAQSHLTISSISVFELVSGMLRKAWVERRQRLISYLCKHEVLPLGQDAADLAGEIEAALLNQGKQIGKPDVLIAATAIQHNLVLTTGNERHYAFIVHAGFPLKLDNWRLGA